ncbi:MAG: methyltransferase domain-containing protein [Bacteroidales bacterium]|nr:methyltransferase domain-containing protein [Bacteroidales bacterium]
MSKIKRFTQRYNDGDIPWDLGRADYNLTEMVVNWPIMPGKTLELGCGTGDNALWMAEHKFEVTAFDLIEVAVNLAKSKALTANVHVDFYVADILKDEIPNAPFDFVFDRGVFHTVDEPDERTLFARNVSKLMNNDGLWLSLIGSNDQVREGQGPPKRSAKEILAAVEPFFELLLLKVSNFDSKDENPAKIWVCLMKKRTNDY